MAQNPTLNTDLEQALYKTSLKEKRLRQNAILAVLVSVIAGGAWLIYSLVELTTSHSHSHEIRRREAGIEEREAEAKRQVTEMNARRAEAEARARAAQEQETAARKRADDIQQRLITVRDEIGGLGTLLTDLSSVRARASKLNGSEAVETQLGDIRGSLGKTLGRIEQQINTALPSAGQKARIQLFVADEQLRVAAGALKKELESSGFEVGPISKIAGRRLEPTEVRYFQEPRDKAEAGRIVAILEKLGYAGSKSVYSSDPDQASGSRIFQVWLSKPR